MRKGAKKEDRRIFFRVVSRISRANWVLQISPDFVRIPIAFFAGFVYRLGREILILERRVRFPYLVPKSL